MISAFELCAAPTAVCKHYVTKCLVIWFTFYGQQLIHSFLHVFIYDTYFVLRIQCLWKIILGRWATTRCCNSDTSCFVSCSLWLFSPYPSVRDSASRSVDDFIGANDFCARMTLPLALTIAELDRALYMIMQTVVTYIKLIRCESFVTLKAKVNVNYI